MYHQLLNKLLDYIGKLKPDQKEKILDPYSNYFIDKLKNKEAREIIELGEKFLKKTELIRAKYWNEMKDIILSNQDERFKGKDPITAMNAMLDEVMRLDNMIIEQCMEKVGQKKEEFEDE